MFSPGVFRQYKRSSAASSGGLADKTLKSPSVYGEPERIMHRQRKGAVLSRTGDRKSLEICLLVARPIKLPGICERSNDRAGLVP